MRVHFGGHLVYYQAERQPWAEIHIPGPLLLDQVIDQLRIPRGEIAISAVNGEAVDARTYLVTDSDEVQFFPPTNGG